MKIKLISMPWQYFQGPSFALGALSAYLDTYEPRASVDCLSEHLSVWNELRDIYDPTSYLKGSELIYLHHLYPETAEASKQAMLEWIDETKQDFEGPHSQKDLWTIDERDLNKILKVTHEHLERLSLAIAHTADVVGLTTTYRQLFSSLCLAKILKQLDPGLKIVLGGWAASVSGQSLMAEYPFIDYIIVGEGELRFLHFVRSLLDGMTVIDPGTGILTRENFAKVDIDADVKHRAFEVESLDKLPLPNYEEYRQKAREYRVLPTLPIEGSRGCSWDQRTKTGDLFQACHFCGLNGKLTRRDKSSTRIADEMKLLSSKYQSTRFIFLDNLIRSSSASRLADAILASEKSYWLHLEIRADMKASALADLKEAGCGRVQIGVEGLSTSYLKRINKGTSTIQNLYVMRACYELEIASISNLIAGFPGSTAEEIEETHFNILNYAIFYTPLKVVSFVLDPYSAVYLRADRFGVKKIKMERHYRNSLPADVSCRLELPWVEFEIEGVPADWMPIRQACKTWNELHQRIRENPPYLGIAKSFFYFDGKDFLELIDGRDGIKTLALKGLQRELYLYCMEIRSRHQIAERFENEAAEEEIRNALKPLCAKRLMFEENGHYLSLAVAYTPAEAIRRIRAEEQTIL